MIHDEQFVILVMNSVARIKNKIEITNMSLKSKKLALVSLYVVGLGLLYTLQPQSPAIVQPEAGLPTKESGGQVVANDEKPYSPPYHRLGRLPPSSTSKPPDILATLKPAIPVQKSEPKPTEKFVTINNKLYPLRTYEPLFVPNDPTASQAWVTNAKLPQTWDIPIGSRQTVLAVIDTGFGLAHEEFSNRWYVNPGESGVANSEQPSQKNCTDRGLALSANCNLIDEDSDGIVDNESGAVTYQNPSRLNCTEQARPLTKSCNRIDDDGNGYKDDVTGWDFANNDNSVQAGELNPAGNGTTHGTRVAGVAAATGNNAKGIAGVDWQTKILPIQALDDDSYGDTLGVGRAILYAAAQGADVISLSLGSDFPDDYVREAIQTATASGSVVVASSGNDGCDCMVYPANYPEVVSVGALNTSNLPATFSSYGMNLDILAPGTQITTPSWTSASPINAYASNVQGTSFATPIVSGLLTRILSTRPDATPLQLIAAVTENTGRMTLAANASRSTTLGYGSLDSFKAAIRMTTPRNPALIYSFTPVSHGNILSPTTPAEASGRYLSQRCEPDQLGTTPVYEMTKLSSHFFTISQTEVWLAQRNGYQSKLFAEVCLQQPHDTAGAIRNLDMFREFRNIYDALKTR